MPSTLVYSGHVQYIILIVLLKMYHYYYYDNYDYDYFCLERVCCVHQVDIQFIHMHS